MVANFFNASDCFPSCLCNQLCRGGKYLDKWRSAYFVGLLVLIKHQSMAVKATWILNHNTYKQRLYTNSIRLGQTNQLDPLLGFKDNVTKTEVSVFRTNGGFRCQEKGTYKLKP